MRASAIAYASIALIALSSVCPAATHVVDLSGGGDFRAIQPAIDAAADGDTVLIRPGVYEISETLEIRSKSITVRGEAGADRTVIRVVDPGIGDSNVVLIDLVSRSERPVLAGLTLSGARKIGVGCTGPEGVPTFIDCIISDNGSTGIGCLSLLGPYAPRFINCRITGNSGAGLVCFGEGVQPALTRCTIDHNLGPGVWCAEMSAPTISSCIVWENGEGSIVADTGSSPQVTYSCIEGDPIWQGPGNINQNPLFAAWGDSAEVHVSNQEEFAQAFRGYSLALAPTSPCLGTGEGGTDIGADAGTCDAAGSPSRLIVLETGEYAIEDMDLFHRVSLRGAGRDETIIAGTVEGLRTGASLSHLTVTGGTDAGIRILPGQSPEITTCTIAYNVGYGIDCGEGSAPVLTDCNILENSSSGVYSGWAAPRLVRCSIFENDRYGVNCSGDAPILTSCIVWGNKSGSFGGSIEPVVTYSCVQNATVWQGEGNTNADPRFCHWGPEADVHVGDAAGLARAIERYSLGLAAGSPCLGTGEGGTDMGAGNGTCDASILSRTVHLAPGMYDVGLLDLSRDVSLIGAGQDETIIVGTITGLRTGSRLSDLTVTGGTGDGISVPTGESPEIRDCTIVGNQGYGVAISADASPMLAACTIIENAQSGVYCSRSSPILSGCNILWNGGSGISASRSSLALDDCLIVHNGSDGVYCKWCSSQGVTIRHCTIALNASQGVSSERSTVTISSSICWANGGGSLEWTSAPAITYSCMEGAEVPAGDGNTNADPLFCAWGADTDVHVASREQLAAALEGYSFGLSEDSPCRGAGEVGTDMGAARGTCGQAGPHRTIHLAPGTYDVEGIDLACSVSLQGAGHAETIVEGKVRGLRTGAFLSDLTVTKGGVVIDDGQFVLIRDCRIFRNPGDGVSAGEAASLRMEDCRISQNGGYGIRLAQGSDLDLVDCSLVVNSEGGASVFGGNHLSVTRCSVIRNGGSGIYNLHASSLEVTSCIVWSNEGDAISSTENTSVSYSCIAGGWPGEGNTSADPLLCAWGAEEERYVENTKGLLWALSSFSYGLAEGSPCIGTAHDGGNMGAENGVCQEVGSTTQHLVLAEGSYAIGDLDLPEGIVSIEGAGKDETRIEGRVLGLRTGTTLSDLTVTAGIDVEAEQSPQIRRCRITGDGVFCGKRASPSISGCEISGSWRGLYCDSDSHPNLSECEISGSSEGLYCASDSRPYLIDCVISGNSEYGVVCIVPSFGQSGPSLCRCTISGNDTGILCSAVAFLTVTDCTISNNSLGVEIEGFSDPAGPGKPTFQGCTVMRNSVGFFIIGDAAATIQSCTICRNDGGIWCESNFLRAPNFWGCIISENEGDGVLSSDSLLTLSVCTILDNGIGVSLFGQGETAAPRMTGCLVSGNRDGGVVCQAMDAKITISQCEIRRNGGYGVVASGPVAITRSTIVDNDAAAGGGIFADGAVLEVTRSTIAHNCGSGIACANSTLEVTSSIVWGNRGGSLGGVADPVISYSCVEAEDVVAGTGNIAQDPQFYAWGAEGEIWVENQEELDAALAGYSYLLSPDSPCVKTGERGVDMGAGTSVAGEAGTSTLLIEFAAGTYNLRGRSLSRGVSLQGEEDGGTSIEGTVRSLETGSFLAALTVVHGEAGGIIVDPGEAPEIRSCILLGNAVAGAVCLDGASPRIHSSTITANAGPGVLCAEDAAPEITSSILWGNAAGAVEATASSSPAVSYCCLSDDFALGGEGNIQGDPDFVAPPAVDFGNFEGDLPDFVVDAGDLRLRPESPCIDAGTCRGAPTLDAAGTPRPSGARCDMGAYEFPMAATAFLRGETNGSGTIDLADAIFSLSFQFASGPEPACRKTADVNDDGSIDIGDPIFLLNHLFIPGSPPPPAPFGACGTDPTPDDLGCESYPPCP
ncbi:MAG: right-handed parallel beta-helix repeat-containing protein [Planctomycetes bacterium]|nr:right-handed parallel beta-helix repeat-containing protein [Planctomycetota bacterium]